MIKEGEPSALVGKFLFKQGFLFADESLLSDSPVSHNGFGFFNPQGLISFLFIQGRCLLNIYALFGTTNLTLLSFTQLSAFQWFRLPYHCLLVTVFSCTGPFSLYLLVTPVSLSGTQAHPSHSAPQCRHIVSHTGFAYQVAVFHTITNRRNWCLEYGRWTDACCKLKAWWSHFVFAESEEGADLYITYSGSKEYVGIHKFGKDRVGPANHDKGICIVIDCFSMRT